MIGDHRVRQGKIASAIGMSPGATGEMSPQTTGSAAAPSPQNSDRVLESLSRLAGGVAHDLNNILLVVQGYTEMALAEPDAGPAARGLLGEVRDAAARASNLVRDLLVVG